MACGIIFDAKHIEFRGMSLLKVRNKLDNQASKSFPSDIGARVALFAVAILGSVQALAQQGADDETPPPPTLNYAIPESSSTVYLQWTADVSSNVSDQDLSETRISWTNSTTLASGTILVAVNDTNCESTGSYPVTCSTTMQDLATDTPYSITLASHGVVYEGDTSTVATDYGFGNESASVQRRTHANYALTETLLAGKEKQVRLPFVRIVESASEATTDSTTALFTFLSDRGMKSEYSDNPHRWTYSATISPDKAADVIVFVDSDSWVEDDLIRLVGTYQDSQSTTATATVTATYKDNASVQATRNITFTVMRNRAPVFGVTAATFTMVEDSPYTIDVSDGFKLSDPDSHTLTFSIETIQPDDPVFEIDSDSGVISLKEGASLDFAVADTHTLHVTAIDSVGAKSNTLVLTIQVEDTNDPVRVLKRTSHQNMGFGEDWVNFHVRNWFEDPDGDNLCFSAEVTSGSAYATVSVSETSSGCGRPHIQVRRKAVFGLYDVKDVDIEITATEDKDTGAESASITVSVAIVYGHNTVPDILGGRLPSSSAQVGYLESYDAGSDLTFDMIYTAIDGIPRNDRLCFSLSGEDAIYFKLVDVANPNRTSTCLATGSNSSDGNVSNSHEIRVKSRRSLERFETDPAYRFSLIATDLSGLADSFAFKVETSRRPAGVYSSPMPDVNFLARDPEKTIDLSDFFEAVDKVEELTFVVTSDDKQLVEVYEVDGILTLYPTAWVDSDGVESCTISVTASNSWGDSSKEEFEAYVKLSNNNPRFERIVRNYSVDEDLAIGKPFTKKPYVWDPDEDEFFFWLDASVKTFEVDPLTGHIATKRGLDFETTSSYVLTLYVEDVYGGIDDVQIEVEVTDVNEPPISTDVELADTTTLVGLGLQESVAVGDLFSDPDSGDSLSFSTSISKSKIATVEIDTDGILIVDALEPGEATIKVTAQDSGSPPLSTTRSFLLTVDENQTPTLKKQLDDLQLSINNSEDIDLTTIFDDEEEDEHTFTVKSADDTIASVSVSDTTLTVKGINEGSVRVTITIFDSAENAAEARLKVIVDENVPPIVAQDIEDIETRVGRSDVEFSLSETFEDPGDSLTYSATTSDSSIATVAILKDGDTLQVSGISEGETSCTVTATDTSDATVSTEFLISVLEKNDPPVLTFSLPDIEISVDKVRHDIDIKGLFDDEAPEDMVLDLETSTEEFADVVLRKNDTQVRIYPLKIGTFSITITATDDVDQSTSESFWVTVIDEDINHAPVVDNPVADQTIHVGDSFTLDVDDVFSDPDGDTLSFSSESDDEDIATATIDDSDVLTVEGIAAGTATITTTATDTSDESASDTFRVTVKSAPSTSSAVAHVTLQYGGSSLTFDLTQSFFDKDGDPLSFRAHIEDPNTVGLEIDSGTLLLIPIQRGTTSIEATATDPDGNVASMLIHVTVSDQEIMSVAQKALAHYGNNLLSSIAATLGDRVARSPHGRTDSFEKLWSDMARSNLGEPTDTSHDTIWNPTLKPLGDYGQTKPPSNTSVVFEPHHNEHTRNLVGFQLTPWAKSASFNFGGEAYSGSSENKFFGSDLYASNSSFWGIAFLKSRSSTNYSYGWVEEELRTKLWAVLPYFDQSIGSNTHAWGTLGYGQGVATVGTNDADLVSNKLDMNLGLLGFRITLKSSGSFQLSASTELGTLAIRTQGSGTDSDPSLSLSTRSNQLRLALDGSLSQELGTNNSITPFGKLGFLFQSGTTQNLGGLEATGGIRWTWEGLRIETQNNILLARDSSVHESGYSLSVSYASRHDGMGWNFSIRPQIGCTTSELTDAAIQRVLRTSPTRDTTPCNERQSLDSNVSFGTYLFNERVTVVPQLTIEKGDQGDSQTSLRALFSPVESSRIQGSLEFRLFRSELKDYVDSIGIEVSATTRF